VFDAWLSPAMLQKFMCPGEGMTCPKAEVDARVGGNFLIVMTAGEKEMPHRGEYKTIDKHDTIAFSWISPYSSDDSLVTLSFEDADEGATKLTLHHKGFPNEESRGNHEGGWTNIVQMLSRAVA
jgi:uncharacterized protein YndB with AHSA1/START domain